MGERQGIALEAVAWAAVIGRDESAETLGSAADEQIIPVRLRRRMPAFSRNVVRCGWKLLEDAPESELILASRFGDLDSSVELLADLASDTLLSPSTFSHSVHNAPPGLLSLCLGVTASHTAVAAKRHSLAAGLTEAYARLESGSAASVVMIYGEAALPPVYAEHEEGGPDVFLGLRLVSLHGDAGEAAPVGPGREGAAALAAALAQGARRLRFDPPAWERQ